MFERIPYIPNDPIEALYERSSSDERPEAINLGIGVYRDTDGKVPMFEAVKQAEIRITQANSSKSYLTPLGNETYLRAIEKLVLGDQHPVLTQQRLVSAQCPGAGGGLRLGAEISKKLSPGAVAWFSSPVWEHQVGFFTEAGLEAKYYRYYDKTKQCVDFEGMLASLEQAKENDLVVIHGCCHNPTGADLNLDQWKALTSFLKTKKLIPFVDIAYQGYGLGIEEDVVGARVMIAEMDNMMLTVSSSKSFSIYRDRAGIFGVIYKVDEADRTSIQRFVRDCIRGTYFMPPDHAASVIAELLSDSALTESWQNEIAAVRDQIRQCRNALAEAIHAIRPELPTQYLIKQSGMFSCFDLNASQLDQLEKEFAIYLLPSGRINFAAMKKEQAAQIAKAICAVSN